MFTKKEIMKKLLFAMAVLLFAIDAQGQSDPHYSMFMFNRLSINPAYAGGKEVLTFSGHYRNQWHGISGAPITYTFAGHTPFFQKRCGIGLSVVVDKIGMVNTTFVDLSYAYRIKVNDKSTLSIGLQGQLDYGRIDWNMADPLDQGDEMLPMSASTKMNPNFGLGAYYAHPSFYVGVSVPRILKTSIFDDEAADYVGVGALRSYYLMGGLIMRMSKNVEFRPAALITVNPKSPFEADLNASVVFMKALWVGASYRLGDSFDFILQYQLTQQLKAAVAVDVTLTELNNYSPGSFEIMLEYCFLNNGSRLKNIRYF